MFFPMQYKRVMWGLILAILDIRIGAIDILPDFAGYILITMALSELAEQHHLFGMAKKFSQWLILITLPDIYKVSGNMPQLFGNYTMAILTFFSVVTVLLKLFMAYFIFRAIMELSKEKDLTELYGKADSRWKAYLFINGAMIFTMSFGINMDPSYAAVILFIPVIPVLIIEILFINLVYNAGKELE